MTPQPPELPIDPGRSASVQSENALRKAESQGLLTFRQLIDMTSPPLVAAARRELGDDFPLPDDPRGKYYYVIYDDYTAGARRQVQVVIPEGHVCPIVWTLALARGGPELAAQFAYLPGMIGEPRIEPTE